MIRTSKIVLFGTVIVANIAIASNEVYFKPIGPWIPVKVDKAGHTIAVLGRQYLFDTTTFAPAQLISFGEKLLADKGKIRIVANGITLTPKNISITYGNLSDVSAEMYITGNYSSKDAIISVKAKYLFEFDGFVWVNLQLSPITKSEIQLERVEFVLPFTLNVAKKLSYARTKYYRCTSADLAGVVNIEAHPKWIADQFRPFITIANESVGLNWFAESSRNWTGKQNQYFLRKEKEGEFGVRFINAPIALTKGIEFEFGFMSLPVREYNPELIGPFEFFGILQGVHISRMKLKNYKGADLDKIRDEGIRNIIHFYWGYFSHPIPYCPDDFKRLVREAEEKGLNYYPYYSYCAVEPNVGPIRGPFLEEIRMRPKREAGCYVYICPQSPKYQDYLLSSIKKLVNEYGVKHLYMDCCKVYECNSSLHGCGDGKEVFNYPIRAVRHIAKEIFKIVKTANPTNTVAYHRSGFAIHAPYECFSDVRITGERLCIEYRKRKLIVNNEFLSALRMTHTPALEGLPFVWIDCGNRNPHMSLLQELALKMLHRVGTYGIIYHFNKHQPFELSNLTPEYREVYEAYRKVHKVYDKFGVDKAKWYGYWQSNSILKIEPENKELLIKGSYYFIKGKRALLILANLSEGSGKAKISINLDKIGLDGTKLYCFDHLANRNIPLDKNNITLHFDDAGKSGSMYLIEISSSPVFPIGRTLAEIEKTTWRYKNREMKNLKKLKRLLIKRKQAYFDFTKKTNSRKIYSNHPTIYAVLEGYNNSPWKMDGGDNVLVFNGKTNYLRIDGSINKQLGIKTEVTIEVMFKLSRLSGNQMLIYKGATYQVYIDEAGYLRFGIKLDGQRWEHVISKTPLSVGKWYHCAFTFDRNSLSIYMNGNKVASVFARGDIPNNKYPLIIGASYNAQSDFFCGCMKKAVIINQALDYETD